MRIKITRDCWVWHIQEGKKDSEMVLARGTILEGLVFSSKNIFGEVMDAIEIHTNGNLCSFRNIPNNSWEEAAPPKKRIFYADYRPILPEE